MGKHNVIHFLMQVSKFQKIQYDCQISGQGLILTNDTINQKTSFCFY